jgi:hypothetical protein
MIDFPLKEGGRVLFTGISEAGSETQQEFQDKAANLGKAVVVLPSGKHSIGCMGSRD